MRAAAMLLDQGCAYHAIMKMDRSLGLTLQTSTRQAVFALHQLFYSRRSPHKSLQDAETP